MRRLSLQEAEDYIRNNYENQFQSDIAKEIGYSQSFVSGRLRKWGLQRITGKSFNYRYFDKWDKYTAYWIGYIMADGCISHNKTKNSWAILLSASMLDYDICERFRENLEVKLKESIIPGRGRYGMWRITILSEYTYNRLRSLGVCERKSYGMGIVDVPNEYLSHYVRGFMDGDGTVTIEGNGYLRVRIDTNYTNKSFIYDLKRRIEGILGIKMTISVPKEVKQGNSLIRLSVSKRYKLKFMEWLYKDSENCRMNRKYEKFIEWLSNENKRDWYSP